MKTYEVKTGLGTIMVTHRVPTNTSSVKAWGESIVELVRSVTEHGFGMCADGSEYDLQNFLCDTWGGHMPWNEAVHNAVLAAMHAHPDYATVMQAFKLKYGVDFMQEDE